MFKKIIKNDILECISKLKDEVYRDIYKQVFKDIQQDLKKAVMEIFIDTLDGKNSVYDNLYELFSDFSSGSPPLSLYARKAFIKKIHDKVMEVVNEVLDEKLPKAINVEEFIDSIVKRINSKQLKRKG